MTDERVERALSQARAQNPYDKFSDEAGAWNEGFSSAWATARAALASMLPLQEGVEERARGTEQRARELLAEEFAALGYSNSADSVAAGNWEASDFGKGAIRAITKALSLPSTAREEVLEGKSDA